MAKGQAIATSKTWFLSISPEPRELTLVSTAFMLALAFQSFSAAAYKDVQDFASDRDQVARQTDGQHDCPFVTLPDADSLSWANAHSTRGG